MKIPMLSQILTVMLMHSSAIRRRIPKELGSEGELGPERVYLCSAADSGGARIGDAQRQQAVDG